MKRLVWTFVVGLAVAGCGETGEPVQDTAGSELASDPVPTGDDGPPPVEAGYIDSAESIELDVLVREGADEVGLGRAMIRYVAPPAASPEQIRRAIVDALNAEADRDRSLVAIRGVVYVPVATAEAEAGLVPILWAEWVPAAGWARAGPRRAAFQRVYTYLGGRPEGW